MASAHHSAQQPRYALASNEFRLPSLKELNFQFRAPQGSQDVPATHNSVEPSTSNVATEAAPPPLPRSQQWSRSSHSSSTGLSSSQHTQQHGYHHQTHQSHQSHQPQPQTSHSQHSPALSAVHEMSTSKVNYSPKTDTIGYMTPMTPVAQQMTPVQSSMGSGGRGGDDNSSGQHNSSKRARTSSQNVPTSRDVRTPHTHYSNQYSPYTSQSQQNNSFHSQAPSTAGPPPPPPPQSSHSVPQQQSHAPPSHQSSSLHSTHPVHQPHQPHPPPTSVHDQQHHHNAPVSSHSTAYSSYQQQPQPQPQPPPPQSPYIHRNSVHPQQLPHHPHSHNNPYPSPASSAPPPQGPWEQQNHQTSVSHHHPQPQQQHAALPPPPPTQHAPPSTPHHMQPPPPPPSTHLTMHSDPAPHHHQQRHQIPPSVTPTPQQLQTSHAPRQSLPPQQQHQQQQQHTAYPPPPVQQPQQSTQQSAPFQRTTLVPTDIDSRSAYPPRVFEQPPPPPPPPAPVPPPPSSPKEAALTEITHQCHSLYSFATRYLRFNSGIPHVQPVQPSPTELSEMTERANQVINLLEEFRRMHAPPLDRVKIDGTSAISSLDDHRAPKRPWEDMSQDTSNVEGNSFQEYPPSDGALQTTAEQDMEIIRTKRATSTAGGSGTTGQPKSKYRKRSRATPPGKCHSCNIRETPEWRRGPDGARTLCNACGLHYAKLMRKREKTLGPNGEQPSIDMDTLRASARANDTGEKTRSSKQQQSQSMHLDEPGTPTDQVKQSPAQQPQQHHQNSFIVMMGPPESNSGPSASASSSTTSSSSADRLSTPSQPHHSGIPSTSASTAGPMPTWGPASSRGGYAPDQMQHQSYMRSSQQSASQASPR